MHVVATAGHVDHGKSTLVLTLTGTDPDRFAEEKTRGLTIDLGFAAATLPSGRDMAFVDVPGHVRFIKNMLAGVGAVDACLFVVAATEGWKPQSEEHLRILQLLGVGHGLVALTKVGVVDADTVELARMDVEEHVAGTFLADAEVIAVDAPTGFGVEELRSGLDRLLAATPTSADRGRPRLWVDRAFAARGSGTVVTGTLAGGGLAVDDAVVLVPDTARAALRVRGLQTHGRSRQDVGPGHRTAVNLAGVAHDRVARGQALVVPRQWEPTRTLDASLTVLAGLAHPVSRRGAYVAYVGSGEHPARLRVLGPDAIEPGATGLIRLHLDAPVPVLPGDRFVLRESGRAETVGGGEVLDVAPVVPAGRARPDRSVERVVAERGWVEAGLLERLTGETVAPTVGRWVVSPAALARATDAVRAAVDAAGPAGAELAALGERERAAVAVTSGVRVEAGRVVDADAVADDVGGHPWLAELDASPFTPPPPDAVDRLELRRMRDAGLVVERDGMWFSAAAVDRAARVVAGLLAGQPDGVTASQVREALGTTRRYLLPLLNHLDATGVTRRRGDVRVAGPRLPGVSPPLG